MKKIGKLSEVTKKKFNLLFLNYHQKFIHSSWLLTEDLGKKIKILNKEYQIIGLLQAYNKSNKILLIDEEQDCYYEEDKIVANALGFTRLRNLVTGKEIDWKIENNHKKTNKKLEIIEAEIEQEIELSDEDIEWITPFEDEGNEDEYEYFYQD